MRDLRLRPALCALAALFLGAAPALAATTLYDFEKPEDFADWTAHGMEIGPNDKLVTDGKAALGARSPKFIPGSDQQPRTAFELKTKEPQDWSGYDRLVIDLYSGSRGQFKFHVLIGDRVLPFRDNNLDFEFEDPPVMCARRYIIPLAQLPAQIDRKNMALLHFFAVQPPVDVDIAIDRIVLLAPGEPAEKMPVEVGQRASAGVAPPLLFDFEDDDSLDYWVNNQHLYHELDRVAQNATSGQWALHFYAPKYEPGRPEWPGFEYNAPEVMDWTPYDRLVFDVANPNNTPTLLAVFISDDVVPFRAGLSGGTPPLHSVPLRLEPMANVRFTIDLTRFPEKVKKSRIAVLHFWSQQLPGDTHLYLDNFRLLKPGEGQPPSDPAVIAATRKRLLEQVAPPPEADDALPVHARAAAIYRAEYDEISAPPPAEDVNPDDPGGIMALSAAVMQMPNKFARLAAIRDWEKTDSGDNAFLLAHAPAMKQVFPRGQNPNVTPLAAGESLKLSAARRENESLQLAVLPRNGDLKKVAIAVGELKDDKGGVFPAELVDVDVVAFVHIPIPDPNIEGNFVGWWPDPLLDWVKTVDVADGDIQPFWLRFRCPEGQEPGVYRGQVTVTAENADGPQTRVVPIELTVRAITLPVHPPMPLSVNTFWHIAPWRMGKARWEKARPNYVKVLERYWLPFDQGCMVAEFDVLEDQMKRGLLGDYNLDYLAVEYMRGGAEAGSKLMLDRLEPLVKQARELGMWEHAYAYGFDELPMSRAGDAGRIAAAVKKAYPDLFLLTTAYDKSLGAPGSPVEAFDGFCPLTPEYNLGKADEARARGKKVWWYVCVGPRPPYANFLTNQPSIDGRMLMGAQSAKYRPDGFLYWSLLLWEYRHNPITEWPYTNWNPLSFGSSYGDGQWFIWGPEDRFVPTMRLENFRDGLEDYAYYKILEATLAAANAAPADQQEATKAWREQAAKALEISEELVTRIDSFTRDTTLLAAWREGMGAALDSAPIPLANPWGDFFGPRGFPYTGAPAAAE